MYKNLSAVARLQATEDEMLVKTAVFDFDIEARAICFVEIAMPERLATIHDYQV